MKETDPLETTKTPFLSVVKSVLLFLYFGDTVSKYRASSFEGKKKKS